MNIEIRNRYDNKIILCGEYENIKACLEKNKKANLSEANLSGADLSRTNLSGADLSGADLSGAYLSGAENYSHSHDFWVEVIRRQPLETFTEKEWAIIGQVYVHRFCWNSIKKRYSEKIMPIFEKLSKAGFGEWEAKYKEVLK